MLSNQDNCFKLRQLRTLQRVGLFFTFLLWNTFSYAQMQSEVQLSSESFLNQGMVQTQKTNFQFLGLKMMSDDMISPLQFDFDAQFSVGASQMSSIGLHEFYFQSDMFQIGRQKRLWSELDEQWKLGVVQPAFRARPLNPQLGGLTGFFVETKMSSLQFTLFASPIFIPELGPAYEINDGTIASQDPWFQKPPSQVRIFPGVPAERIDYQILKPTDSEVIFQKTFGIQAASPRDGLYFQGSYLYKPNNQLGMGYNGFKSLTANQIDRINVEILPKVYYHHITTADIGWNEDHLNASLSVIYDQPEQIKDIDNRKWTYPIFKSATLVSPSLQINFKYFETTLSRLDISGGEVVDQGDLANSQRGSLTNKYFYRHANMFKIKGFSHFAHDKSIEQVFSYTFHDRNTFQIIKWSPRAHLSKLWHLYGEVELINAKESTADEPQQVYNYVDHDRAYLGVGYVF